MPPRKSNASAAEDGASAKEGMSVEELALPRTMIQRLAKGVLPANTQIQKDALLALSKSATVFVNYVSGTANENAQRAGKKTIQPRDVFDAMHDLEFDDFMPRMEAELLKYNTVQCDKRNTYRRKVREEQLAQKAAAAKEVLGDGGVQGARAKGAGGKEEVEMRERGGDEERASKKLRAEGGEGVAVDEGDDDGDDDDMDDDGDGDEQDHDDEDDDENEGSGDELDEDEDESADERPNDHLAEDPLEDRDRHGIGEMGDEALDGDESD